MALRHSALSSATYSPTTSSTSPPQCTSSTFFLVFSHKLPSPSLFQWRSTSSSLHMAKPSQSSPSQPALHFLKCTPQYLLIRYMVQPSDSRHIAQHSSVHCNDNLLESVRWPGLGTIHKDWHHARIINTLVWCSRGTPRFTRRRLEISLSISTKPQLLLL